MAAKKLTFEQQMAELEEVVQKLEHGNLALEESVGLFERGMQLSNACRAVLTNAESRIQVLVNPREDGRVTVEELAVEVGDDEDDFEDGELDDEELSDEVGDVDA